MVVVALTGTYGLFAVLFAYKVHGGGVNNNNTNGGSIDLARHKLVYYHRGYFLIVH
jgi:hypothetical protein